jgi:hypothetical protein
LPALAALVDYWWEGVEHDLEPAALSVPWRHTGPRRAYCHGSIGRTRWPTHDARADKPRCGRPARRHRPCCTRMSAPCGCRRRHGRRGPPGRRNRSTPFSVRPQLS